MGFRLFVIATTLVVVSVASKVRFDKYHVYGVLPENDEQLKSLHNIEKNSVDYDFWNLANKGTESTVMVPPHKIADFEAIISSLNLTSFLKSDNVQELIDNEQPNNHSKSFGWTSYGTLDDIYNWLDIQLSLYPNVLTSLTVGRSFEGRIIRAVRISYKPNNPIIILESNIHAREWITSATATWIINEFLTSQDPIIRDIAENFDWIIVPVLNVDGYVFTHTNNRMWRKTRQQHGIICTGADPNRNFDFQWNTVGASSFPCAEDYAGPRAFSEPEARHFADFVGQFSDRTKMIISFHSFGQYLLYPYGHTRQPTHNQEILHSISRATALAIAQRFGTDYLFGSSSTVLYLNSGSSIDWAYDRYKIDLAFIFELRDRRNGRFGFILPADQIIPNSLELLDGIVAMIGEARALNQL